MAAVSLGFFSALATTLPGAWVAGETKALLLTPSPLSHKVAFHHFLLLLMAASGGAGVWACLL